MSEKEFSLQTADQRLQSLVSTVSREISEYSQQIAGQIDRLAEIGIALSAELNLNRLLEMIVDEARRFTKADAGTLYILEDMHLKFKIMQNDTFKIRKGGTSGDEINLPPVPLNKANVSAYVAITGETVNIPDVYVAEGFDFTGPKKYDQATGYRSKSMLVVPMKGYEGETIGVLQLLNSKDEKTTEVIPFSWDFVALTRSLASQAAVAITTARLINDMQNLFDSFVSVMATAIDERSPYTAGHIKRVADLGVLMCEVINEQTEGTWASVKFTPEQIKEIKIAGWMHDIGKITTPVHVVDKSTKLETIFDRIDAVRHRFMLIEATERNRWLEQKIVLARQNPADPEIAAGEAALAAKLKQIEDDLKFLEVSNKGGEFMDDAKVNRIKEIAMRTFSVNGAEHRYLSDNELENLLIRKGTLLDSERKIMQDHAAITIKMLQKIPFTKNLKNVPIFAGTHHEYLDGTGYPQGLKGDQIPLQGRILALVDLYEALTASDRPYKKAMPIDKVFDIMKFEADKGKLDKDLYELFMKSNLHGRFNKLMESAKKEAPDAAPISAAPPHPRAGEANNNNPPPAVDGKPPVIKAAAIPREKTAPEARKSL